MLQGPIQKENSLSGFHIFETGEESLDARLFLIRASQKTLDLQYYAISDGISSNLLIEALIQSAQRGVRVRLMIDDISAGDMHRSLIALDGINNIEIRIFNPLNKNDQSLLARFIGGITHISRATRRMHNKALIADNQMAIIGGRNLGDEYFDAHEEFSFKDIDVLTAGPATALISNIFDEFWNGLYAFPIFELHKKRASLTLIYKLRAKLKKNWRIFLKNPANRKNHETTLKSGSESLIENLIWAKSEIVADTSDKIKDSEPFSPPLRHLKKIVDGAAEEFIIISAYFVPRESGVKWLASLCDRGMAVKVLTNSLASNDVVAVHAGYKKYRKTLLEKGISIFELKPHGGKKRTRQRLLGRKSPSYARLHAKAYIIDNKQAVIGSFNFDPRSAFLNTEIGLFIDSAELAGKIRRMFDESSSLETSYKLGLGPAGKLFWGAREKGNDVRYTREPKASIWRILQVFLISLLPVEEQL
jgi:putative cardiolipin synthase